MDQMVGWVWPVGHSFIYVVAELFVSVMLMLGCTGQGKTQ